LARAPFTSTFPPATASLASDRVLKNRAAQSHLSMRTRSSSVIPNDIVELRWSQANLCPFEGTAATATFVA
jgi:hypothetical protein